MKNVATMYYLENNELTALSIEKKYVPFVRERIMMKEIRRRIFSERDEKLLKDIKNINRPFEVLGFSSGQNIYQV